MENLNKNSVFLILDIGGTNINYGLVDDNYNILLTNSFPTNPQRKKEEIFKEIFTKIKILKNKFCIKAICVGVPGWVNFKTGYLIKAPNIPGWDNLALGEIFKKEFKLPVIVNNDSNLYALGEWQHGAGQNYKNLIALTLGTGVGSGLILNSQLWYGSFSSCAEIGHMVINPNSQIQCNCQNYGCLETLASATGLIKFARNWQENNKDSNFTPNQQNITAHSLFQLAQNSDTMALAAFKQAGEALGLALANVFNMLGLEIAIIGGGVSEAFKFFYPALWQVFSKHLLITNKENIKIVQGTLNNNAPLLGGATLLKQQGF